MKSIEVNGWLLEIGDRLNLPDKRILAWISDPQRYVLGFAYSRDETTAVLLCLSSAKTNPRANPEALEAILEAYSNSKKGGMRP